MKKFVFPITTGRSGTAFLTELLRANWPEAQVFHERTSYTGMGVDSPDASHLMLFNSVGNVRKVQEFWEQKFDRLLKDGTKPYAEISHFLFKAGLVENLGPLLAEGEVHLVLLTRDMSKIHWSYVNRHEFTNNGYTWLFALDPSYPSALVSSTVFKPYGSIGSALWYVYEVFTRMDYYEMLMADVPNVHIHRVDLSEIVTRKGAAKLLRAFGCDTAPSKVTLPPKTNATPRYNYGEDTRARCLDLLQKAPLDSQSIAKTYFESGRRLAFGGYGEMRDFSNHKHAFD
jgi:hypothetical protein